MSTTDNSTDSDIRTYQFSYSIDIHGFLRKVCSHCGLSFKIKPDPNSISQMLAPEFRQIEKDYGVSLLTEDVASSLLICPYCGQSDSSENMTTEELLLYIHRWAKREVVHPIIDKTFQDMAESINRKSSRSNKGLFSIKLNFDYKPSLKPIRPIHGPEPSDMLVTEVQCCKEMIKILEKWTDSIFCPFCSEQLILW